MTDEVELAQLLRAGSNETKLEIKLKYKSIGQTRTHLSYVYVRARLITSREPKVTLRFKISGKKLANVDWFDKSDPYLEFRRVTSENKRDPYVLARTAIIENNLNPNWDEWIEIDVRDLDEWKNPLTEINAKSEQKAVDSEERNEKAKLGYDSWKVVARKKRILIECYDWGRLG